MAAHLLYQSVPGLCLIISRAARYLLKPVLNNIPSLCVYYNLYGCDTVDTNPLKSMSSGVYKNGKILKMEEKDLENRFTISFSIDGIVNRKIHFKGKFG